MRPRTVLRPRRLSPAEQAADRLHAAIVHLLRRLRRQDARLGVGPSGLSVLSVLVFGGPCTMSRLAEIEQVTRPTMSRLVAGLERNGLVTRERDADDRRAVLVRATSTGRIVMQRGRANRVEDLAARLRQLTRDEANVLDRAARLIERLARG